MRKMQESTLCGYFHGHSHTHDNNKNDETESPQNIELYEHKAVTKYGQHVYWYPRVEDVPKGFTFYLAHEFFDALPINKFTKTEEHEWREVLIDIDNNNELRFVQAKFPTPTLQLVDTKYYNGKKGIEISPKTGVIIQHLSDRIDKFGGGALIADYGENEYAADSFRGFKNHKLHDVLRNPGTADLTADVDFSYIRRHCSEHTVSYGPVPQKDFLYALGINLRYKKLSESSECDKKELDLAYRTLTDTDKMGHRFKFFSIFPKTMLPIYSKHPPAGFLPEGN